MHTTHNYMIDYGILWKCWYCTRYIMCVLCNAMLCPAMSMMIVVYTSLRSQEWRRVHTLF